MRKEVKIGIYAVTVIAAAIFCIEFLKGKNILSSEKTYYTVTDAVDGLNIATPVTIAGYTTGSIADITYCHDLRRFVIAINIDKHYRLPEDSHFEIYSADLLGSKKVRVILGSSIAMTAPGDTLMCKKEPDMISGLISRLGPVISGLGPVISKLDNLLESLNTTAESVNSVLSESNRRHIAQIVQSLNASAKELNSLMAFVSSISSTIDSAAVHLKGTVANTEELTAALKAAGIDQTIVSIRQLADQLQNPEGSIGKMLTTDSLYNSLTSLSCSLDSLVKSIQADPKKYVKISLF